MPVIVPEMPAAPQAAYVVPPPPAAPNAVEYQPQAAPRKKSHAVLITVIVIVAVLVTVAVAGVIKWQQMSQRNFEEAQKKTKADLDLRNATDLVADAVNPAKDLLKTVQSASLESQSLKSLSDARDKLVQFRESHEKAMDKLPKIPLESDKAKAFAAELKASQEKVAKEIDQVDAVLWPGPDKPNEMGEKIRVSVPQIIIPAPPGSPARYLSSGTGFVLEAQGKWYVATNRHVVTDAKDGLTIIFRTGPRENYDETDVAISKEDARKILIHKFTDIAAIPLSAKDVQTLKAKGIRPLPLNPTDDDDKPKPGDHCWVYGHPGGNAAALDQGIQATRSTRARSPIPLRITPATSTCWRSPPRSTRATAAGRSSMTSDASSAR